MCGICFICSFNPKHCHLLDVDYIKLNSLIGRRGPDTDQCKRCTVWSQVEALFAGFVLHLRGQLTPQPLTNADGDLLLWNGEIFGGIEVGESENDTQVLLRRLANCSTEQDILATVQSIQGPWAMIFWQAKSERLWFGRDVFGRRSLLWHLPQNSDDAVFMLSSVPVASSDYEYQEVPSLGMYMLESSHGCNNRASQQHSDSDDTLPHLTMHLFPWQRASWPGDEEEVASLSQETLADKLGLADSAFIALKMHGSESIPSWMPTLNCDLPDDSQLQSLPSSGAGCVEKILQEIEKSGHWSKLVDQLTDVLQRAVHKRVHNLPRPSNCDPLQPCCVTNSRGSGESALSSSNLCVQGTVDAFGDGGVLAASQGISAQQNNSVSCKGDGGPDFVSEVRPQTAAFQPEDRTACNSGLEECEHSTLPENHLMGDLKHCAASANHLNDDSSADLCTKTSALQLKNFHPAHVAILFSGGIDSTVLAALADRCLPPDESIDLINVAFQQKPQQQNPTKKKNANNPASSASTFNVPDRLTGYTALAELNQDRQWNFVEVNVSLEELQEERSKHVRHLVSPLCTVLDDSIGCAVWFAARGRGTLGNGPYRGHTYTSTARVILCGMGADEQLAGYSRHRVRFQQQSWAGLVSEINMEIHRISARNLGRDDRIITDHGKESRFPFLDEEVVAFLAALPIQHKADLRLPRGLGEKLVLRLTALRLGLLSTAVLPKRAIQFGSRIAKLETSKEKGSSVCSRLAQQ